jgi:putative heme-binding domain-containing protein
MKDIQFVAILLAALIHSTVAQTPRAETKLIESQFSGHPMAGRTNALPAADTAKTFTVPDDLEMQLVLAEPIVTQPVFLNFDERGRMWVVQYLQYPAPAGLKAVSRDNFWRAVYDKVPEPPPRGVKGLDKITIHEDTNGDGTFDTHKTFVDGLNIATACAKGRGGVWVLNPPYLLFYPDRNDDDVPDSDPVVHLEGFGLEDTHSVVNSLRWGPDGWLYAAQGSTVTANVRRPDETNVVYSQGQNIWRYHPESKRYEIFSEGGGNAFGVEIDEKGRLFSGHNGGDTRGFHYMQGAYLRKGFEKHGELANPYAFGYFPHMDGTRGERFTHNFVIYHGGALPERYTGKLFGIEPLQGRVVLSDITPVGSTFATRDLERVVTSSDSWFRPVDIKVGPDGAIYVADWYDRQVTHTRNQEGYIDKEHGRIYRLKSKRAKPLAPFNLANQTSAQLIETLRHTNQWFRETALRVLADRRDTAVAPVLRRWIDSSREQISLEALWALHQLNQPLTPELVSAAVKQRNEPVLTWMIRLMGDDTNRFTPATAMLLLGLASSQTNVEVRAQIAATAKRLPAPATLAVVAALSRRAEDAEDPRIPLLCWWALESKCDSHRDDILKLFGNSPVWFQPLIEKHLLSRLMRRYAAAGSRKDLLTCAKLLELSPSPKHTQLLMTGFEEAFSGRSLTGLPDELVAAMARHNVASDALKLRTGDPAATRRAIETIQDERAGAKQRQQVIGVLGEVRPAAALNALLTVADRDANPEIRKAALTALMGYDDTRIPALVLKDYNNYAPDVRSIALGLVASRAGWSLAFVQAVDKGKIQPAAVPLDGVRRMKLHAQTELAALITKLWPRAGAATTAEMQQTIQRLGTVIQAGTGNPYAGQTLFNASCASCHTLFARGGKVGPDLTTYQRGDLDTMLLHIVNPSAEIREGYENILIETKDDRSLTGFLVERDAKVIVLRSPDGQNVTIEHSNVAEMRAAGMSLMPEGLLDPLNDQQVRDLFAYLRSTQPLANY